MKHKIMEHSIYSVIRGIGVEDEITLTSIDKMMDRIRNRLHDLLRDGRLDNIRIIQSEFRLLKGVKK